MYRICVFALFKSYTAYEHLNYLLEIPTTVEQSNYITTNYQLECEILENSLVVVMFSLIDNQIYTYREIY